MISRRYAGVAALIVTAALAGCMSEETKGKGAFVTPTAHPTESPTTPDTPRHGPIDLTQWSHANTCDILQMSTSADIGILIATPQPPEKGNSCIYAAKDSTYTVGLFTGTLSDVPMKDVTRGPVHYRENGLPALRYCDTEIGELGCAVVLQAGPNQVYAATHYQSKGKADADKLTPEVRTFSQAVFAGLKARTMLHPVARDRYPTQKEYDGDRKKGLQPEVDVCNGRILRFTDLPYDGMRNSSQAGPTRFRNQTDFAKWDVACTWDVSDFVKGYTPPAATRPDERDPSVSLQDGISKSTQGLTNLADIYKHSRVIFVTIAFKNDKAMKPVRSNETTYRQANRTVIIDKQADGAICNSRFRYGHGVVQLSVADSTGGRYGSPCTATRSLTTTALEREPH
ncbi:MAG TPA: hypothetical protein VHC49_25700 [Mycobacteriales bacterium]|nr:hypothetical protein [Mycobacteriales bacterium]